MAQHYYYVLLGNDYVMSDLTDLSSHSYVVSFEIHCFIVCKHKYMNMSGFPPIIELAGDITHCCNLNMHILLPITESCH